MRGHLPSWLELGARDHERLRVDGDQWHRSEHDVQTLEGFDVHIMTANPDGEWPGYAYCEGGDGQCATYWPNCGPYAFVMHTTSSWKR